MKEYHRKIVTQIEFLKFLSYLNRKCEVYKLDTFCIYKLSEIVFGDFGCKKENMHFLKKKSSFIEFSLKIVCEFSILHVAVGDFSTT